MRSSFPGMNPYLEQSAFWSSFHTRLMVAIADALVPELRPNYYIEVETRTYRDPEGGENEDDELLIGIPDAAVLAANSSARSGDEARLETGTVLTQNRPQSITLPMPIVLKERYLVGHGVSEDTISGGKSFTFICPLKRLSHRPVEIIDECQNPFF